LGLVSPKQDCQSLGLGFSLLLEDSMTIHQPGGDLLEGVLHRKVGLLGSLRDPRQLTETTKLPGAIDNTLLLRPEAAVAVAKGPDTRLAGSELDGEVEETRVQLELTGRHSEQNKEVEIFPTLPGIRL
jgi:hypothetical protein